MIWEHLSQFEGLKTLPPIFYVHQLILWISFERFGVHGWRIFYYMHEGKWELVIDENHDAMFFKCIKVQSVGRMGKWAQNKMEMFHEEVGFNKTQIFTFVPSCNYLH